MKDKACVPGKALAYTSTHFRLVCNDRPEVVELAAIHRERIYSASTHA